MRATRRFACLLSVALVGPVTQAYAQPSVQTEAESADVESARSLGYRGTQAYLAGDFEAAERDLRKAYALVSIPTLGLWHARSLIQLGRYLEADRRLRQVLELTVSLGDTSVQQRAIADARTELAALAERTPTLRLTILGADPALVTVTIDGVVAPASAVVGAIQVDPGTHDVEVRTGSSTQSQQLKLKPSQQAIATFDLSPPPNERPPLAPPPPPALPPVSAEGSAGGWRTQHWVGASVTGLGVTGLAVGGVFALIASATYDSAKAACPGQTECPSSEGNRLSNDAIAQADFATGFAIVGLAVAAIGVTVVLTAPSADESRPSAAITVAPLSSGSRFGGGWASLEMGF